MPAWHDQFTPGCPDRLTNEIDEQFAPAFATIKKRLDGLDHLSCEVRWMGIPWRWSYVYHADEGDIAYLVPDPQSPMLAMPIALEQLASVETKKLARSVREGIARARVVDETAWVEWELASQAASNDVGKFVAKLQRELAGV